MINVSTPGNVAETILVIIFVMLLFSRNYHNIKYMVNEEFHSAKSGYLNYVIAVIYMGTSLQ